MSAPRIHVPLLLAPAGLVLLSLTVSAIRGPYDLGMNLDPEYQVLLNSLNLATLKPSYYIEHPATTLQVLTVAVILVRWALTGFTAGWDSVAEAVVTDHVAYLRTLNIVMVLLLAALLYVAARRVCRLTGFLPGALVFQVSVFMFLVPVESLGQARPELALLIAGTAVAIPLAKLIFGPNTEAAAGDPRLAAIAGVLVAAGIATKLNFFPLALFGLLFAGWRQKLRFAAAAALSLPVLLLPIAGHAPAFFHRAANLVLRTGHPLRGEVGLPSASEFAANVAQSWRDEPYLFCLAAFHAAVLLITWLAARDGSAGVLRAPRRAMLAGLGIIVLHTALAARNYRYHYILPALLALPLINAAAVELLRNTSLRRALRIGLAIIGVILGYEGLRQNYFRFRWYAGWKQSHLASLAELAVIRERQPDCLVIGFYRSSAPTFALAFGNWLAQEGNGRTLERVYPGQIHMATHSGVFYDWQRNEVRGIVERRVAAGGCVLVQGEASERRAVTGFQTRVLYEPPESVYQGEGLYRLDADARNPALIDRPEAPSHAITRETRQPTPAAAEYVFETEEGGRYAIRLRYSAAGGESPVRVWLNGELVSDFACHQPTGGAGPEYRKWHETGAGRFRAGKNTVRIQADEPAPAVDRVAILPIR